MSYTRPYTHVEHVVHPQNWQTEATTQKANLGSAVNSSQWQPLKHTSAFMKLSQFAYELVTLSLIIAGSLSWTCQM